MKMGRREFIASTPFRPDTPHHQGHGSPQSSQQPAARTARQAAEEVDTLSIRDVDALATIPILDGKPFICGDRPCGADATVFALASENTEDLLFEGPFGPPFSVGRARNCVTFLHDVRASTADLERPLKILSCEARGRC